MLIDRREIDSTISQLAGAEGMRAVFDKVLTEIDSTQRSNTCSEVWTSTGGIYRIVCGNCMFTLVHGAYKLSCCYVHRSGFRKNEEEYSDFCIRFV